MDASLSDVAGSAEDYTATIASTTPGAEEVLSMEGASVTVADGAMLLALGAKSSPEGSSDGSDSMTFTSAASTTALAMSFWTAMRRYPRGASWRSKGWSSTSRA